MTQPVGWEKGFLLGDILDQQKRGSVVFFLGGGGRERLRQERREIYL